MSELKKRVGFVTSSILLKTGFSTNASVLLPYLYKTKKYEIFHLNQSINSADPNLGRMPWRNFGVFDESTFDTQRFHNDQNYQRHVSYGNAAVERFIIDNRLDCVIHIEDPWSSEVGSYINSRWFTHLKDNFLQWTTVDSSPILPIVKEWASSGCSMWIWSDFARKMLHQEDISKYKHIEHVFGTLNINDYTPLPKNQKLELRKQFNINPDTKIFIQLGRNQLRKLYPHTLEAFARFKKQFPEHKAKLLFHCHWSEPMGWPLERLVKEHNLKNEDVLTTYFCRNCGKWEIKPFSGEEQKCRFCGSEKSQLTAGVTSTISNKELSYIYGVADASISAFTSGGMEYTNPQSLLCGLPLLCSEYSCGEDFVNQDFIYKLDGTFAYEVQTGFKKHTPNLNTMVKFFRDICSMSEDKRAYIGQKGREWALKTFNVDVIGKKVENWIDSRQPHNWDFKYTSNIKNPNAIVDNHPDNKEFLKRLYKDILLMSVNDDDSGLVFWLSKLSDGGNRDEIISFFKKTALEENHKNGHNNISTQDLIIKNGKKNLVFVIPESIGDIIWISCLFKDAREKYPDYNIYISCKPELSEILDGNPYLDKIIPYSQSFDNLLFLEGHGNYSGLFDIAFLPHLATQRILSYIHNGQDKVSFDLSC